MDTSASTTSRVGPTQVAEKLIVSPAPMKSTASAGNENEVTPEPSLPDIISNEPEISAALGTVLLGGGDIAFLTWCQCTSIT